MREIVLIAVLKSPRDLKLLLKNKWYRIPLEKVPRRKFDFIAFYQPALFRVNGKRIKYYAKPEKVSRTSRIGLLPEEIRDRNARKIYLKYSFRKINKLRSAIKNKNGLRVSFGFTDLLKLKKAAEITDLYDVVPIEKIMKRVLNKKKIACKAEYPVWVGNDHRYRLDFAVFCKKAPLNVECDSLKWHSQKSRVFKDKLRDERLKRLGWSILRLKEKDITSNILNCIDKVNLRVKKLGGIK
jgi:very-short-patch-repair endonuclease